MLENIPISGLAICYGPLALTIIGFIAFAVLTDADARRPYLRRLDPRTETERGDEEPLQISEQIFTSTPSGMVVEIIPEEQPETMREEEQVDMSIQTDSGVTGNRGTRSGAGFREGDVGPM